MTFEIMAMLLAAGLWAGMQNALAGGGSFVTLPALIVSGAATPPCVSEAQRRVFAP